MHVLFFTYDVPYPPNSGGKTRALNLLKFGKAGITYSLFSFTREGFDLSNLDYLKEMGIETIELFPRKSIKSFETVKGLASSKNSIFSKLYFDKKIEKTLSTFIKENHVNVVHFESFYTGFYLSSHIRKLGVKQIYGSENIEYKIYEEMLSRISFFTRPFLKREVEKVRKEEIAMVEKSDVSLAVTKQEAEYFASHSNTPVFVIENGVSMENFPKIPVKKRDKLKLLFIGNFSYFPNKDGLEHFYTEVFSKLDPGKFELIVVGRGASSVPFLQNTSVETIEYIPDVYDAYAMSDVFVSPIKIGGGTNFKVLEAMAGGLPVVAYKEKTENMGFISGRDILQVETAQEFFDALEKLHSDTKMREMLSENGRKIVSRLYNWELIGRRMNEIWKEKI